MAVALTLIVVAYNNAINRWAPFHSWAYVPANLLFAASLTASAAATLHLSRRDLGIRGDVDDLVVPLWIVGAFAIAVFSIARSRQAHRIADKRVTAMRGGALAWYVLVRIPVGTAMIEELIFRGVLFAVWRDAGASDVIAALCSSVAFGLWHVAPAAIGLLINDPEASRRKVRVVIIGAVLLTTTAGMGLTWLRLETDGLLAPIFLHAAVNSVGALAAVAAMSGRRPAQ